MAVLETAPVVLPKGRFPVAPVAVRPANLEKPYSVKLAFDPRGGPLQGAACSVDHNADFGSNKEGRINDIKNLPCNRTIVKQCSEEATAVNILEA